MSTPTELIVALDFKRRIEADALIEQLQGMPITFKVGFELFISEGPVLVRDLIRRGFRVFLDLKLHDIPNTVAQATERAADLGASYLTLHLSGGPEMVRAAREAADLSGKELRLLGVSVLTSFSEEQWATVSQALGGTAVSVSSSVHAFARHAKDWGVHGMVCAAPDLIQAKTAWNEGFFVTPGIRPEGSSVGDQKRVVTPQRARELGSDAIVVGRPITLAQNPKDVVQAIFRELGVN
jgi:orotidine-5'-phosphate decarboxylase